MVGEGLEPELSPSAIRRLFHRLDLLDHPRPADGELSVALLDDAALAAIHAEFLQDPTVTDVITFPGDAAHAFGGEICVSLDRARAEARSRGIPVQQELVLYLIHGWLHLAGLDDRTETDRERMRAAEARLMAHVEGLF